jgi:hypothetical protein
VREVRAGGGVSDKTPRLALSRRHAAEALDVSLTFFEERIQPELAVVRLGGKVLVPVAELESWVARRAELTVPLPGTHTKRGGAAWNDPPPTPKEVASGAHTT